MKKQEIVAALAAARERISTTGDALRESLDVTSRATENFQQHRPVWLSGAALVGFVLSRLPARKKTVFVERATGNVIGAAGRLGAIGRLGSLFSAAKTAIDIARPLLSELSGGPLGDAIKRFRRKSKSGPVEPPGKQ